MTKNLVLAVTSFAICIATSLSADAQDAQTQLLKAISDLTEQQAQLTENQTKIDGKIADLAETTREARLYMSRAGGTHKALPIPKK